MPAPSAYAGSQVSAWASQFLVSAGTTTFAMGPLNSGWCCRFTAKDTRDILTVYVNWATVTAAGVVACRVETIDATTGKPSGTLYDANATVSQAPVAGWQAFTFATPPTAGLTAGTEYAVVLLTTTGGTAHPLRSHAASAAFSVYPTAVLTAADGTTRSNFAEVATSVPIVTLVYEDGQEEVASVGAMGAALAGTAKDIYGTNAAGLKFVVPAGNTWTVDGVFAGGIARTGSPNDLRVRILNSSDAAVSGTTRTADKDSLTGIAANRRLEVCFAAPVALTAGTYRVVFDDAAQTGTNSNKYTLAVATLRSSALSPSGLTPTSTTNISAGPPVTWTDDNTVMNGVGLLFGNDASAGGGYFAGSNTQFIGGAVRLPY